MTKRPEAKILNFIDDPYNVCVLVPIKDRPDLFAKLFRIDFDDLMEMGATLPWVINNHNVMVRTDGPTNKMSVARLIMDAIEGEDIQHKDGDQLNLKRTNLIRLPGKSRGRARDLIAPRYKVSEPVLVHIKEVYGQPGELNNTRGNK